MFETVDLGKRLPNCRVVPVQKMLRFLNNFNIFFHVPSLSLSLLNSVTCSNLCSHLIWAEGWQNQQNHMCAQRSLRSAWACPQSDQSIRCPHEESFGHSLTIERTVKTLTGLGGCPGWSESSLGAQVILLAMSCFGSFVILLDHSENINNTKIIKSFNTERNYFWLGQIQPRPCWMEKDRRLLTRKGLCVHCDCLRKIRRMISQNHKIPSLW